ncbi:hypothetical protein ACHAWF_002835 [Thalassiosira exigua]
MSNDFHSLLSVFRDATSGSSDPDGGAPGGAPPSSGGRKRPRPAAAAAAREAATGATPPSPSPSSSDGRPSAARPAPLDPAAASDPNFSAPLLKARIERLLRVRQVRRSTKAAAASRGVDSGGGGTASPPKERGAKREFRVAICATIVDDFPHERLWRKWIDETGGDVALVEEGKADVVEVRASADLRVHAKNPERIRSEWLRSKLLPLTHRPNWNDVRVVRAMLSLLDAALGDEETTHVLFCTESCVPVATLKEVARAVLLDEACPWTEARDGIDAGPEGGENGKGGEVGRDGDAERSEGGRRRRRVDWDRSFADCYGRDSGRCTRFDEPIYLSIRNDLRTSGADNCWGTLRDSVPGEAIYKASSSHVPTSSPTIQPARLDLPRPQAHPLDSRPPVLSGRTRPLARPSDGSGPPRRCTYFLTALSLADAMEEGEGVCRRSLTHARWD